MCRARGPHSKTDIISVSPFQPCLACTPFIPPLKPPCQPLPNLPDAQSPEGKSSKAASCKCAAGSCTRHIPQSQRGQHSPTSHQRSHTALLWGWAGSQGLRHGLNLPSSVFLQALAAGACSREGVRGGFCCEAEGGAAAAPGTPDSSVAGGCLPGSCRQKQMQQPGLHPVNPLVSVPIGSGPPGCCHGCLVPFPLMLGCCLHPPPPSHSLSRTG